MKFHLLAKFATFLYFTSKEILYFTGKEIRHFEDVHSFFDVRTNRTFTIINSICLLIRDIVKASHLKPLEKDDRLTDMKFTQPWNTQASKKKDDISKQATDNIPKVKEGELIRKLPYEQSYHSRRNKMQI